MTLISLPVSVHSAQLRHVLMLRRLNPVTSLCSLCSRSVFPSTSTRVNVDVPVAEVAVEQEPVPEKPVVKMRESDLSKQTKTKTEAEPVPSPHLEHVQTVLQDNLSRYMSDPSVFEENAKKSQFLLACEDALQVQIPSKDLKLLQSTQQVVDYFADRLDLAAAEPKPIRPLPNVSWV